MNASKKLEKIAKKYENRILAILKKIANALEKAGFLVDEPGDISCDNYQWTFTCHLDGNIEEFEDPDIDFTLEISNANDYDGEDGLNFCLKSVRVGGEIISHVAPYNYTDQVWVKLDDAKAIEERFKLLEDFDPEQYVKLVQHNS